MYYTLSIPLLFCGMFYIDTFTFTVLEHVALIADLLIDLVIVYNNHPLMLTRLQTHLE